MLDARPSSESAEKPWKSFTAAGLSLEHRAGALLGQLILSKHSLKMRRLEMIEAALVAVRRGALEEAAKLAENSEPDGPAVGSCESGYFQAAEEIAAAIRALAERVR